MAEEVVKTKEPKFGIESLVNSSKYRYQKDVLRVVLEKGKEYTIKEVENKIEAFMKGGN